MHICGSHLGERNGSPHYAVSTFCRAIDLVVDPITPVVMYFLEAREGFREPLIRDAAAHRSVGLIARFRVLSTNQEILGNPITPHMYDEYDVV